MAEAKQLYIGSGHVIQKGGLKIQLDLTELGEYLRGDAKHKVREWKDKNGKIHKSIDIAVFPLKEENQSKYRTHSVKIDMWEKPESPSIDKDETDDIPF